jgi:hypothetical protein
VNAVAPPLNAAGLLPLPATSNGVPVCTQPLLRVYACVRGTCGDGICETGEAPSCGCVADCPDAAWGTGDGGPDGGAAAVYRSRSMSTSNGRFLRQR